MLKTVIIGAAVVCGMVVGARAQAANPMVKLETNKGAIVVELYPAKAPKTVENFLEYVKAGFYDGTIFHRVIPNFMIQGGGFTADLQQKPTRKPIVNEADNGLSNGRGTIAMARTSAVDSATAQFFINLRDNTFLDHKGSSAREFGYCVFGRVVKGMEVVDAIAALPTGAAGPFSSDVPKETVKIVKASVVPAGKE